MTRLGILAGLMVASFCAIPARARAQPNDARTELARGISALHEFEYEDASDAFTRARTLDPGLAMAYWGEAMSYHQSLWNRENLDAARAALARFGPTPTARAAKCKVPKDAGLLAAADALFGAGTLQDRRRMYADAMRGLHERFPDDPDIAAFYGLALLATTTRGLIGTADHDAHPAGLAGSEIQRRVGELLEAVLASHPGHRGALHYLLHNFDDPEHAVRALKTARAYATIASASHARHMPAHIFLQLGLWEEAAAADRVAYDASVEWTTRRGLSAGVRNYHALSWHEYELLQLGRYRDAEQTLHTLEPLASRGDNLILLNDYASMRARFVVETERWDLMAGQTTFTNVNDLFAVGLSVAHLGRRSDAERVHSLLAQRAQAMEEGDLRPAIAIMERELAAAIAAADGRTDEAIATLSAAARAELALPPPVGLPQPIKPAPEMLGELLVTSGRPGDAIEWFERALRRNANRSPSVAGLARARAAIQTSTAPPPSTRHSLKVVPYTSRALALGSVLAAVLVAVVVMRRRAKKKGPAPVKGAGPKASAKRRRQKR